jgi:SSS family solute:Na+ symporter
LKSLHWLDYLVIALYLAGIAAVGLYMARRQKTTADYFIANRRVPAWAVAFTLMATFISSMSFIGHPGAVFKHNFYQEVQAFALPVILVFVVIYIVPFYRRVVGMSAYEYMEKRFGLGARLYTSAAFIVLRILDLGFTIFLTALAIGVMTNWNITTVIVVMGIFTLLYTMVGGIEGVIWTDVVQGIILIGGGLLVLAMVLYLPEGGPSAVLAAAGEGGKFSFGDLSLASFSTKSFYENPPPAWLYFIIFMFQFGRAYITEQNMVQRYLVARTDREAKQGATFGALMCAPIWLMFGFVGACLYGFYQVTGQTLPTEITDSPEKVLPYFVLNNLPIGVVGLILAAIIAAAQSSVSADLNSVSTVMTSDFFARLRPASSDKSRLVFGRAVVLVVGLIVTATAVILSNAGVYTILQLANDMIAIVGGGILGLFALAFLTRGGTRTGAYIGIAASLVFTAWATATGPMRATFGFPPDGAWWNFNMYSSMIGVIGNVLMFVVGYAASRLSGPPRSDLAGLTIHATRTISSN